MYTVDVSVYLWLLGGGRAAAASERLAGLSVFLCLTNMSPVNKVYNILKRDGVFETPCSPAGSHGSQGQGHIVVNYAVF